MKSLPSDLDLALKEFCESRGLTLEQIRGPSRCGPLIEARQEFFTMAYGKMLWTLKQIGNVMNRDHTMVLHYVNRNKREYKPHLKSEARKAYEARNGLH